MRTDATLHMGNCWKYLWVQCGTVGLQSASDVSLERCMKRILKALKTSFIHFAGITRLANACSLDNTQHTWSYYAQHIYKSELERSVKQSNELSAVAAVT